MPDSDPLWHKCEMICSPLTMYRVNRQPELPDFYLPLGGKLDPKDRWVRVTRLIPWHLIEEDSRSSFATIGMGAPARESCIACGALIIKALFGEIEEATVDGSV